MYTVNDDGSFTVSSRSKPEQKWIVSKDINSCNCPKFKFILRGQGSCHHMDEVRESETAKQKQKPIDSKYKTFNSKTYTTPLHLVDFTRIYGDSQLDILLALNHVIIIRGLVRKLQ